MDESWAAPVRDFIGLGPVLITFFLTAAGSGFLGYLMLRFFMTRVEEQQAALISQAMREAETKAEAHGLKFDAVVELYERQHGDMSERIGKLVERVARQETAIHDLKAKARAAADRADRNQVLLSQCQEHREEDARLRAQDQRQLDDLRAEVEELRRRVK